jgi:crotonobetainyl-CoA:carnitine CoA-transferase CaiB-like acyl-CoA transferase
MDVRIGGPPTGPLSGVKVVDLSSVVSGPLCAQLLGDLGADVVKVESPGGDTARHLGAEGPPAMSGLFAQFNRNKRGVVLDLKQDAGREAFLALAAEADIVVENFRAGVADRLGIGFEAARARNPGLIWVAISGFGPDGPYADQPAYDMVIQGMSGFARILGDATQPRLVSNLFADKTSGLSACYAVLAALYGRERRGGRGQRIDVPMIDAFSSFVLADGFASQTWGGPPADPRLSEAIYRAWKTADGHVAMLIIEDRQYEALCRVLDREELIDDPRFASLPSRIAHAADLFALLATELQRWTTAELVERAHRFGAPLGPVYDVDGFLADPQVRANRVAFDLDDDEIGAMKLFRSPPRYESTPTNVRRRPPRLGEHTEEVLREAGLDDDAIRKLVG